jgi:hypothetical protein
MSQEVTLTSEMRARIIDKIARVLFHSHNHSEKRQPLESPGRVNFACPYCGDSHDNPRKKRGNLYWADLFFHCYNCSAHKSLDTFLGDFNQSFEGEERINVLNYIRENHKSFSLGENLDFYLFDKIKGMALTFEEIALAFNVYPINELTYRAYPYLKSRLLHLKLNRFAYDPRRKELYVFNLTSDDKIVGFQVRALEQTSGVKYKTWNMQRIYDRMNRDLNLPEEEVDPINKISMLFGILQADLGRDFTVFEGPIDAMFMNNSIGLTGVKKQIVEFDEIPTTRYFFDNDIEGKTKMIEKLKKNQRVFMWSKFLKDFHIPSKKVKDLNDLIQYEYKERTGCLNRLEQYFTSNQLDMIFL